MSTTYAMLPVEQILYDTNNPRIKMALMKYGDQLNAERIHFALRSATEESTGTSSYNSLTRISHQENNKRSSIEQ